MADKFWFGPYSAPRPEKQALLRAYYEAIQRHYGELEKPDNQRDLTVTSEAIQVALAAIPANLHRLLPSSYGAPQVAAVFNWLRLPGFGHLTLAQRCRLPPGGPTCICQRTRQGVKFFEVSDMRHGGRRYETATKREANRIVDAIYEDQKTAWAEEKAAKQ